VKTECSLSDVHAFCDIYDYKKSILPAVLQQYFLWCDNQTHCWILLLAI